MKKSDSNYLSPGSNDGGPEVLLTVGRCSK